MDQIQFPPLTKTVKKGGCAAKLPAGTLREILSDMARQFPYRPKELILGSETMDDAALWDLGHGQLQIQTLDFFTPIVDDPKDFGSIAAANAISDIYAMGGRPTLALTILAFPASELPLELLKPLMEGAQEVIQKAGAVLAGGHSIDDETLKLGFSVTGIVPKNKVWMNSGSKPGDVLILTKALGTGTITTALKNGDAPPFAIQAAIESMKTLNQVPDLIQDLPVHAATDITGFGLAGHCMQMAKACGHGFLFDSEKIPSLPWAIESIQDENLNRAHKTNLNYTQDDVHFGHRNPAYRWLSVDPQTSGGLLLSIPEDQAPVALERIKTRFPIASIIGSVVKRSNKDTHWVQFQ